VTTGLLVVCADWIFAIWHLFVRRQFFPREQRGQLAGAYLITLTHTIVAIVLWKFGDKVAGWVFFFLFALSFDAYEHLLHASANNIFTQAPGNWTAMF